MRLSRRSILKWMVALFTVPVFAKIHALTSPSQTSGMVMLTEAADKARKAAAESFCDLGMRDKFLEEMEEKYRNMMLYGSYIDEDGHRRAYSPRAVIQKVG